ncbi:MAG: hypothetical protein WC683_05105 [bacterium]
MVLELLGALYAQILIFLAPYAFLAPVVAGIVYAYGGYYKQQEKSFEWDIAILSVLIGTVIGILLWLADLQPSDPNFAFIMASYIGGLSTFEDYVKGYIRRHGWSAWLDEHFGWFKDAINSIMGKGSS